ncbi:hypothetical protein TraAM80_07885 [Trypanosoma rangeli]|uniref:Ribonuclease H2 subunit B wHTH domain-containing protein n=1 Tax=Trypanosoma rangeli TaxID=5698 RepID=A0A3R7MCD2_TRYRA|nr:uncharacterized protein TraAM80_07885 [Trypanosoma rangeli]RNE99987.1 hypothetical protein TraAM80_07885 [Trypanosoma rangeli]|eukprot:RNE99987.1 hypothetical protein TraAM80_07885 [Trypanosoma rangeli]
MRATKRCRSTSSSGAGSSNANDGRLTHDGEATVLQCGSHLSSCCSSDGNSPRRRLELDEEGSQSVLLDPSNVAAWAAGNAHYDASDRTIALPRNALSSHMMVLPRTLLKDATAPTINAINDNSNDGNINSGSTPQAERTRTEGEHGQPSPDAAADDAHWVTSSSPRPAVNDLPALRDAPPPPCGVSLRPGCNFVRLPHPRHGEPALFLCPPNTESASRDVHNGTVRAVLYEVQAQLPPGGFGQTWFVNDTVEPNEELLVVTPFDVTFFVLRQAATHVRKEMFVSAEDLIMGATKSRGGGAAAWPGWRVALAQCPALTPAVEEMQSHTVLSRICDVKSVGGDHYYRFSVEKMGEWLRDKLRRVANSAALHAILQLGPPPATRAGSVPKGGSRGGDDKATSAPLATAAEVPLPVVFGVVAEYLVEEVSSTAAQLCGAAS